MMSIFERFERLKRSVWPICMTLWRFIIPAMQNKQGDTCLYFGTFNPIHTGHLMIAQTALLQTNLQRIVFIPTACPPHRNQETDLLAAHHRLKMVHLATAANPAFSV